MEAYRRHVAGTSCSGKKAEALTYPLDAAPEQASLTLRTTNKNHKLSGIHPWLLNAMHWIALGIAATGESSNWARSSHTHRHATRDKHSDFAYC